MNVSIIKNIDLTKVEVVHISKKWDTSLFRWWFHVSVDYKKIAIVAVEGPDGAAIKQMIANPPQGKRFAMTNYPNSTSWDLVDQSPQVETPVVEETPKSEIIPEVDLVEWQFDPNEEQFLFLMRDKNGVLSHCYRPWSFLEAVKHLTDRWEVQRIDGGESWVIAQSVKWSAAGTVAEVMHSLNSSVGRVIDGLRVEVRGNRTHIYFQPIRHSYSPYVEVSNNHGGTRTMAVIGSVSDFNFEGFTKAVALAKSMIVSPL